MPATAPPGPSTEAPPKKRVKDTKNCGLLKCFSALVDRKQVNLELDVLILMLKKELHIKVDSLDPQLSAILPYILVFYIKNWPGWQRSVEYYSGKMAFKVWYEKFYKFITIKLNETINIHYKEAKEGIDKTKSEEVKKNYLLKKITCKNTQTDYSAPKVLSPFSIKITAKPVLLNTLVFTDNQAGDIVLKQHSILEWDKNVVDSITLQQIITWPHVGVHMYSPVLAFSRRNLHEFTRHISFVGTSLPTTYSSFIEEIKIINQGVPRTCYTVDYLKALSKEFMDAIGHIYKKPAVKEAFQTVIDELLADVAEINVLKGNKATIASNTSVLFNIGRNTYFRNKKLSRGTPSRDDISFTEVIMPKMETSLVNVSHIDTFREYIEKLKKFDGPKPNLPDHHLPSITFSCSYCKENFEHGGALAKHLKEEHKMEQAVLCTTCKESYPVFQLTRNRWGHKCRAKN